MRVGAPKGAHTTAAAASAEGSSRPPEYSRPRGVVDRLSTVGRGLGRLRRLVTRN